MRFRLLFGWDFSGKGSGEWVEHVVGPPEEEEDVVVQVRFEEGDGDVVDGGDDVGEDCCATVWVIAAVGDDDVVSVFDGDFVAAEEFEGEFIYVDGAEGDLRGTPEGSVEFVSRCFVDAGVQ